MKDINGILEAVGLGAFAISGLTALILMIFGVKNEAMMFATLFTGICFIGGLLIQIKDKLAEIRDKL